MEQIDRKNGDIEMGEVQSAIRSSEAVKNTVLALVILLALSLFFGLWCWRMQTQANQILATLRVDAQQLLNEKKQLETELVQTKTALEEKQDEMEQMFNTLYPAYAAVENIRYVGKDTNIYHRHDCPLFRQYDTYTAHNSEYCELLGYLPCPTCCP